MDRLSFWGVDLPLLCHRDRSRGARPRLRRPCWVLGLVDARRAFGGSLDEPLVSILACMDTTSDVGARHHADARSAYALDGCALHNELVCDRDRAGLMASSRARRWQLLAVGRGALPGADIWWSPRAAVAAGCDSPPARFVTGGVDFRERRCGLDAAFSGLRGSGHCEY